MLIAKNAPDAMVALRSFAAGLAERHITVLHQDADMVYDLVENLPRAWPVQELEGRTDSSLLSHDWAQDWIRSKHEVLQTGRSRSVEIGVPSTDGCLIFDARIKPDLDAAGNARGVISVLSDITDFRQREQALVSLMREVSHRSKNLLAIVQSVASQTAHHSEGVTDFMQKFRGRLQALASIQDLVTESNWRGTLFRSLVAAQIARSGEVLDERVRVSGDNPMLGPNAALHVGLAIHELMSNARRFGALSRDKPGTVWISSNLVSAGESDSELVIEWLESKLGNRPAAPVPRFGTMVLEKIVPLSVGGSAQHELGEDGLSYRLHVPAGNFET